MAAFLADFVAYLDIPSLAMTALREINSLAC
jgi:hypothetical protein